MEFLQFLKQHDQFGTKAEFTYKSQTREGVRYDTAVKTTLGAFTTIIFHALFMSAVIVKTNELFNGHE